MIAVAITVLGVIIAYVLTTRDSTWFYSFVPAQLANGRGPTAAVEDLRDTLFSSGEGELPVFATFLFTHNAQIALFAFAA